MAETKAIQEKKALEEYLAEIDKTLGYFAKEASRKTGLDIDDARQEMLIQAWKAYETYDPNIAKFTTYAGWRMKQRIKSLIKKSFLHSTPLLIQDMANANLQDPTASATVELEERMDSRDRERELDEIEEILERIHNLRGSNHKPSELACKVFAGLREGKSLSAISREEQVQLPRLSTVFTRRVKKLGTREFRGRIVRQIEEIETKSAKARKEKGMAKEKKAERATRKGGMTDKIEYVRTNFVAKGKSRSEAIAGLRTKYPDMSANYAKTLVYGKMQGEKFAKSERKPRASKSAKKGKLLPKKTAKKPAAAKPKDENFDF